MIENQKDLTSSRKVPEFLKLLETGTITAVREKLAEMHTAEIALILEAITPEMRTLVWKIIPLEKSGDVLAYVNDDVRLELISKTNNMDLVAAIESLDTDDLADIFEDLPDFVSNKILKSLDEQHRKRLEAVLSYSEDTAGGLMNTDTITVRPDISLGVVLRYLRLLGKIPEMTDSLIVVDRQGMFQGLVSLTDLLTKAGRLKVEEIMTKEASPILAEMPANEVAALFEHRDLISAPVVDAAGFVLGRITIDDVVDVIRDEADHNLMSRVGLNEEYDIFAPVVTSSRRRTIWLGVNLITALIASWVISQFGETIEKMVALAVLMPLVASMGGVAGSQTLTLVIRGIALNQINYANAHQLLIRELAVGFLNGIIWALVVAAIALFWFDNFQLAAIIACAMLINLIFAALAGATLPLLLKKFRIDPALAGGVILTTVTDVIGFFAFLGLAALLLI